MRHFIITLAIASASIFNSSYAADGPTPRQALASFRSTYSNATDIAWSSVNDHYQASFLLNGRLALALYSADGTPIAESKKISSLELPAKLRMNLKKELKQGWISDLFVVTTDGTSEYFAAIEDADTKVVLKSVSGTKWTSYQRIAK